MHRCCAAEAILYVHLVHDGHNILTGGLRALQQSSQRGPAAEQPKGICSRAAKGALQQSSQMQSRLSECSCVDGLELPQRLQLS
jgi:hypothetical protein